MIPAGVEPRPGTGEEGADPGASRARYKGLDSYTEADAGRFGGRGEETSALLSLVEHERCTILHGLSGTGKSSLLRAGLFPQLRARHYLPIPLRLVGSDQATDVAGEVRRQIAEGLASRHVAAPPPGPDRTLWEYFHATAFWSPENHLLVPVLVFDQFEELFTHGRRGSGLAVGLSHFLYGELQYLIENRMPEELHKAIVRGDRPPFRFRPDESAVRVLLSLREDSLADLIDLRRHLLPSIGRSRLRLRALTRAQAVEAVLRPAADLMDPGVAEAIVDFVSRTASRTDGAEDGFGGTDVEAPLLSLFCERLEHLKGPPEARFVPALLENQGVRNFVADFYEESLRRRPEAVRRWIEESLLTADGQHRVMRTLGDAEAEGVAVGEIEALQKARLLRVLPATGTAYVELIHDCLIDVVRSARGRRQVREAEEAARRATEEEERQRRAEESAARLAQAEEEERARERERERTQAQIAFERRRRRWVAGIAVPAALVATALAAWALRSRSQAEDERRTAEVARADAEQQRGKAEDEHREASRAKDAAVAAKVEADGHAQRAERALGEATRANARAAGALLLAQREALAAAGDHRAVGRWAPAEAKSVGALALLDGAGPRSMLVDILAESPLRWTARDFEDGASVLVSDDGRLVVGDDGGLATGYFAARTARLDFRVATGVGRARFMAVDASGGRLAVADPESGVSVLRLGQGLRTEPLPIQGVQGLAFYRSSDRELRLWVVTAEDVRWFSVTSTGEVEVQAKGRVERSRDTIACFGDGCPAVALLEPVSGAIRWVGTPPPGVVEHVTVPNSTTRGRLSRDGRRLAVAAENGVRVCDLESGRKIRDCWLDGAAQELAFDAEGVRLLTLEAPSRVHVWQVDRPGDRARPMVSHAESAKVIAAAWNGRQIGVCLKDSVRLLSLEPEGRLLPPALPGEQAEATLRAWAPGEPDRRAWMGGGRVALDDLALRRTRDGPVAPAGSLLGQPLTGGRGWLYVGGDGALTLTTDWGWIVGQTRLEGLGAPAILRVSGDGRRVAALDEQGRLALWSLEPWAPLPSPQDEPRTSVALSSSGALLASGDAQGVLTVHEVGRKSEPLFREETHGGPITALSFGPEDRLLAIGHGGADSRIDVWDMRGMRVCATASVALDEPGASDPVDLRFSSREGALLVLARDGRVSTFQADVLLAALAPRERVLARAAERLGTDLSRIESERPQPRGLSKEYLDAAAEGKTEDVRRCLLLGVDRNVLSAQDGYSALTLALAKGSDELVTLLLDAGVDVNSVSDRQVSALHVAALKGRVPACELLIRHGADLGLADLDGQTPLHFSALAAQDGAARVLLAAGAKADRRDTSGRTPLLLVAPEGNLAKMPTLLAATRREGALDVPDDQGRTAVHRAAEHGDAAEVALLRVAGARLDLRDERGRQPLHVAAGQGAGDVARLLLAAGVPLDAPDRRGRTPLLLAVSNPPFDAGLVRELLERGASPSVTDADGDGGLSLAILGGAPLEILQALADGGAAVAQANREQWLPIHFAAQRGRAEAVELLLAHGSPIDAPDQRGWTALHKAVRAGKAEVARLLLAKGADPNLADSEGWTALHKAIAEDEGLALELARRPDVRVGVVDATGLSELHKAAILGQLELVKVLVSRKVPLNGVDQEGRTPILGALDGEMSPVVRWLGEQPGVDLNAQAKAGWSLLLRSMRVDEDLALWLLAKPEVRLDLADRHGMVPLHLAAGYGRERALRALLARHPDLEAVDEDGWTAVFFAVEKRQTATCRLLLGAGANPNAVATKDGSSPLQRAAKDGALDLVTLLLDAKADPNAVRANGWSAVCFALDQGHVDVALRLLERGANPRTRTAEGLTLLHFAAHAAAPAVIRVLLAARLDPNATESTGLTPLHLAALGESAETVQALLDGGASRDARDAKQRRPIDVARDPAVRQALEGEPPR